MNIGRFGFLLAVVISLHCSVGFRGITLGQIDTFEDGTQQGWGNTNTFLLTNPSNGPGGSNDHYLSTMTLTASGGDRLDVFNQSQWLGNYLAAGVTGVEMDLKNNNLFDLTNPLSIRIAIRGVRSRESYGYSSTTAYSLSHDGQWHHAIFSLSAESFTAIGSFNSLPPPLAERISQCRGF